MHRVQCRTYLDVLRRLKQRVASCRLALWLLIATAASLSASATLSAAVIANAMIETVVVKLRNDIDPERATGLTQEEWNTLYGALQVPFSLTGITRDGAYRLDLLNPLPMDAARAALNRARLLPTVLYASIVPTFRVAPQGAAAASPSASTPTPAPTRRPVSRLIVKFRDAATSDAAKRNEPLSGAHLDRLAAQGGQPVAHERSMSGGAYVVRLFQALSADQAEALAASLASDPTVEYAEPDRWMQPLLAPNDPRYPEQWHYMSPAAFAGGANLPPAWDLTTGSSPIAIAVIDTGGLPAHPDLAGRLVGGYDFISDSLVANDGDGRDADRIRRGRLDNGGG